jgi:hypothetical protein
LNITELLRCDGVGRLQLESRTASLVRALLAIEDRLQARADNAARLAETHPDPVVRQLASVRESAYRTALGDVQYLMGDVS